MNKGANATGMGRTDARCTPRSKRNFQRLTVLTSVVIACGVTLDSRPAPGHSWRPLLIADIAIAWAVVVTNLLVGLRSQRREEAAVSDTIVCENLQEAQA